MVQAGIEKDDFAPDASLLEENGDGLFRWNESDSMFDLDDSGIMSDSKARPISGLTYPVSAQMAYLHSLSPKKRQEH